MVRRYGSDGSINDLIMAGTIQPGKRLLLRDKGRIFEGTILPDGRLQLAETIYSSPSTAVVDLVGYSENGWRRLEYDGKSLNQYRDLYWKAAGRETRTTHAPRRTKAEPNAEPQRTSLDTPLSQLLAAEQETVRADLLARLNAFSGEAFEKFVCEFLRALGFSNPQNTRYHQDGGVDGTVDMEVLHLPVAFQAKRWTKTVGSPDVAEFKGSIGAYERGIYITTSTFSDGAREMAKGRGVPIVLMDGADIVERMIETHLGLIIRPVNQQIVDDPFFKQFEAQGQ
jgi:restriction endonuclease Mrr